MEVLHHITPYFGGISPYIALTLVPEMAIDIYIYMYIYIDITSTLTSGTGRSRFLDNSFDNAARDVLPDLITLGITHPYWGFGICHLLLSLSIIYLDIYPSYIFLPMIFFPKSTDTF